MNEERDGLCLLGTYICMSRRVVLDTVLLLQMMMMLDVNWSASQPGEPVHSFSLCLVDAWVIRDCVLRGRSCRFRKHVGVGMARPFLGGGGDDVTMRTWCCGAPLALDRG